MRFPVCKAKIIIMFSSFLNNFLYFDNFLITQSVNIKFQILEFFLYRQKCKNNSFYIYFLSYNNVLWSSQLSFHLSDNLHVALALCMGLSALLFSLNQYYPNILYKQNKNPKELYIFMSRPMLIVFGSFNSNFFSLLNKCQSRQAGHCRILFELFTADLIYTKLKRIFRKASYT